MRKIKTKIETVTIPMPLTDDAKADAADRLLELQKKKNEIEEKRASVMKELKDSTQKVENEMSYEFSLLERGVKEEDVECRKRKNFSVQPPLIQYVDPKDDKKVIHEVELNAEDYQVIPGDWIIDEKGKGSVISPLETSMSPQEDD